MDPIKIRSIYLLGLSDKNGTWFTTQLMLSSFINEQTAYNSYCNENGAEYYIKPDSPDSISLFELSEVLTEIKDKYILFKQLK